MVFSVIIPVYNVEKYLSTCVESVLGQTHQDLELILVDDGSTDGSGNLCDDYARKDSRIKVLHKPNGGQSTARNLGLQHAVGDFVCFLDSDDFYTVPDVLEQIAQVAEQGAEMVLFRYQKYYTDGRTDSCGISMADLQGLSKARLLETLVKRDAFFCSCWSKSIRADILKRNNILFDETLSCEDMDWFYQVLSFVERIQVIDQPFVNYRQRENSVTACVKDKTIRDYIVTLNKWQTAFAEIENEQEKATMLSSLAKLYCNLLISYARNKRALNAYRKEIFAFRGLLSYDLNPRTKVVRKFADLFGLRLTCALLNILDKVR